ncbi:MAG: hypothetical protein H0T88_00640 [Lysobacter sp.]|nr:hypothetical protein [Lysobacter sp.]
MNTSSSDRFAPEPLTPEERAMAMRLTRIGPHGEPSPALDAHIIGAAHAATGSSRSATRWPALIGLAATLALAVGITWQLKPVGEPTVDGTVQETASAPAAEVMTAPADMARQHAARDPQPPPAASHEATREQEAPKASVTPAPARSAGTTQADPVPTPPAPAAPSVATPAVIASDNAEPIMRDTEDRAALRAEREALSRSAQDDDALSRARPPRIDRHAATAASPEAFPADSAQASDMAKTTQAAEMPVAQDRGLEPEDWIERIRLRRDSGDIAGARESLQLLRREHPQTLVPSDLVELTQEQP